LLSLPDNQFRESHDPEFDVTLWFSVGDGEAGQRLDLFLSKELNGAGKSASRSVIQRWIHQGLVTISGSPIEKPRRILNAGDRIQIIIPKVAPPELVGENIPLQVLFEDPHIIVVDKPRGMVVHPGAGNETGTLVNALLYHCEGALSHAGEADRPGIVHRLDKDTSGCLVAAKSDAAFHSLVSQFANRTTRKEYIAVVRGVPPVTKGRIENRIGRHPIHRQRMTLVESPAGKEAITEFRVEASGHDGTWSRIRCLILTGRTHQIRVHMKESLRCPILGDPVYGKNSSRKTRVDRLMLHADMLELTHPESGEKMTFRAALPEAFSQFDG